MSGWILRNQLNALRRRREPEAPYPNLGLPGGQTIESKLTTLVGDRGSRITADSYDSASQPDSSGVCHRTGYTRRALSLYCRRSQNCAEQNRQAMIAQAG